MTNWTKIKRITAPNAPAISIDDVKAHLNITEADDHLQLLIDAAIAHVDGPNGAGLALITQTYRQTIDPNETTITLPVTPVSTINSVLIDGVEVDYTADLDRTPARVAIGRHATGGQIVYQAGFGDNAADVPADLRAALLLIIGHLYANREAVTDQTMTEVPMGAMSIIRRWSA